MGKHSSTSNDILNAEVDVRKIMEVFDTSDTATPQSKCASCVKYYPEQPKTNTRNQPAQLDHANAMPSFPRGVLVIFDMYTFSISTGLQKYPRVGTEKDANNIKDLFLNLGFVVYIYTDVKREELLNVLRQIEKPYSKLSCFACAVLSYGMEGHFYAHDSLVKVSDVFSVLESPNWVDKPKLFFIQGCQEERYMDGINQHEIAASMLKDVESCTQLPLLNQSDYLYTYSTPNGYSAWRNCKQGSRFIQELCESFQKYSDDLDLTRILTRANNKNLYV